jgi:hypothetical protein
MNILDRRKPSWSLRKLVHELQAMISSQRVRKVFSLWESSTSQDVRRAYRPLEACNTMPGSIPCVIIDGSFYQGYRKMELSERAIVWWCEVKISFAEKPPSIKRLKDLLGRVSMPTIEAWLLA